MKSWIPNNVKLILTDNPVKVAEIKKSENTYIAFLSGKSTNLDMGCNIFSESCDKYLPTWQQNNPFNLSSNCGGQVGQTLVMEYNIWGDM